MMPVLCLNQQQAKHFSQIMLIFTGPSLLFWYNMIKHKDLLSPGTLVRYNISPLLTVSTFGSSEVKLATNDFCLFLGFGLAHTTTTPWLCLL
jgi:hypothetical protein